MTGFDLDAWLARIGYDGPRTPSRETLAALITAHTSAIPFEAIDPFLGRVPALDLPSLHQKLIANGRGGYCYEQNMIFRAGLNALGFTVTSLIARVVIGLPNDAATPAAHMTLRVDLPEGPFLADVGFGGQTPTAPIALQPHTEQSTPHEPMRLLPVGEELLLQAKLNGEWSNLYRISPHPAPDIDYEVANWFVATNPGSPFVGNLIMARSGPDGMRYTFLNGRLSLHRSGDLIERRMLENAGSDIRDVFGLDLSQGDLEAARAKIDRTGIAGAPHPFFR